MREEGAGDPREKRAEDERLDLYPGRVHSHRLRRDLVLAHREERQSANGKPDVTRDGDDDDDHQVDPEEVRQVRDVLLARDPGEAARPPDDIRVLDGDTDDLPEAEGDDSQVVAAQAEGGQAD